MAPKYQFIADELRHEIKDGTYSERQPLPTEQLLCRRFDISRQTIRKALSILEGEGLITRRQGSGSYLRGGTEPEPLLNCTIAVVTTYINDYIFPTLLQGIESVLTASGSAPLLFATQNQVATERKVLQTLLTLKHLDGVLVEGSKTALPSPNLDLYQKLIEKGVRLIFLNGTYPEMSHIPSVLADDYGGGKMLVEYLHGKGHQAIAGIFKSDDMQGLRRYAGCIETMRNLDLLIEDGQFFWYNTEARMSVLSERGITRMLERLTNCSAIVCYNDEVAIQVVSALKRQQRRIPEDVSVVSFDNSRYSDLSPVRITSLSRGEKNIGSLAAELMLQSLRGKSCASEVVPWILVEKESS